MEGPGDVFEIKLEPGAFGPSWVPNRTRKTGLIGQNSVFQCGATEFRRVGPGN